MNLMLADIISARDALSNWGIPPDIVTAGWVNGEMSLIVEYDTEADDMLESQVRTVIETLTSTTLPVVVRGPKPTFHFNFDTAP